RPGEGNQRPRRREVQRQGGRGPPLRAPEGAERRPRADAGRPPRGARVRLRGPGRRTGSADTSRAGALPRGTGAVAAEAPRAARAGRRAAGDGERQGPEARAARADRGAPAEGGAVLSYFSSSRVATSARSFGRPAVRFFASRSARPMQATERPSIRRGIHRSQAASNATPEIDVTGRDRRSRGGARV